MTEFVLTAILVLGFVKALEFLYIWQVKEYRLDRMTVYLQEEGIVRALYGKEPHMAAKTIRNLIIILFNALLFVLLGFVAVHTVQHVIIITLLLLFTPVLGFLATATGVAITSFLATLKREQIIQKARIRINHSHAVFIGITGSYGKTTTKEVLYHILSQKYRVAKTDKNLNTDVGVAISVVQNLQDDTQFFIAEVGAYRRGEITRVCNLIKPTYGILTAIGNQHMALFGSRENLILAKKELLEALPSSGHAYVNQAIQPYHTITSGIRARVTGFSTDGPYGEYRGAVELAQDLGLSKAAIDSAVKMLPQIRGKLSIHEGINGSRVLADFANSNVDGFIRAIEKTAALPGEKKIIISKGIIELGNEKRESYQRILAALNPTRILLLTTDSLFLDLATKDNVQSVSNEKGLLKRLKDELDPETLLLIEGKFSPPFISSILKQDD